MAALIKIAEIGRVKKIDRLPPDMVRAWRREFSANRPRTKARTKGTMGYSSFFMT
jgi:hypothetical protein